MEALSQDFIEEENFNLSQVNDKNSDISYFRVLIDRDSDRDVTNTDIVLCINEHHKNLADDQEVGVIIQHLGKQIVFYIDHIAHQNQSMIYFKGHTVNGRLVHFVKHSSELKIELHSLPRRNPETPKAPFGFTDWDSYEKLKLSNR